MQNRSSRLERDERAGVRLERLQGSDGKEDFAEQGEKGYGISYIELGTDAGWRESNPGLVTDVTLRELSKSCEAPISSRSRKQTSCWEWAVLDLREIKLRAAAFGAGGIRNKEISQC